MAALLFESNFPVDRLGIGYAALWKANRERPKPYSHQMIDAVFADGRNSEIGVFASVHGLIPESIDQACRFQHLLMETGVGQRSHDSSESDRY